MNVLQSLLNNWIFSRENLEEQMKETPGIYFLCNITKDIDMSLLVNEFMSRVKLLNQEFSPDALTSGAACFFGSLIMSLLQVGYIKNIDELFTLSACYMVLDHYLDNPEIESTDKEIVINELQEVLKGNTTEISSPIVAQLAEMYLDLVAKIPLAKPYLRFLFKEEVDTMYLQRKDDLELDEYFKIAERKGGFTCYAIQAILEIEISDAEWNLGTIIQLIDDIVDIEDDIEASINTVATFHIKHFACLNRMFTYTLYKIITLENKYNFFKPVLIYGLLFSMHLHREYITPALLDLLKPYFFFAETSKDNVRDKIYDWLQC